MSGPPDGALRTLLLPCRGDGVKRGAWKVEDPGGVVGGDAVAVGGGPQVDEELGGGLDVLGGDGCAAALAVGGEGGEVGAGLGQRVGHGRAPTRIACHGWWPPSNREGEGTAGPAGGPTRPREARGRYARASTRAGRRARDTVTEGGGRGHGRVSGWARRQRPLPARWTVPAASRATSWAWMVGPGWPVRSTRSRTFAPWGPAVESAASSRLAESWVAVVVGVGGGDGAGVQVGGVVESADGCGTVGRGGGGNRSAACWDGAGSRRVACCR